MAGSDNPLRKKKYWNQFNGPLETSNEKEYFDSLCSEYFEIYGIPVYYYPSIVNENKDRIFGEDTSKEYFRKHHLTGIIVGGQLEENLFYNGFGQINQVDFQIYFHRHTFLKHIQRVPLPSDQFFLPNSSALVYEVNHVDWTTLGQEGNFFGHQSGLLLTCKEREVSGEQYGITDDNGNLLEGIDPSVLLPDGRVPEKYNVKKQLTTLDTAKDNDYIKDVTDGEVNPDTGERDGGITIKHSRTEWGDW